MERHRLSPGGLQPASVFENFDAQLRDACLNERQFRSSAGTCRLPKAAVRGRHPTPPWGIPAGLRPRPCAAFGAGAKHRADGARPLEAQAPPPDPRRPATFNEHGRGVESLQKAPCRRGKEIVWFIWLRGTAVCFCCYVFNSRTLRYLKSFSRAVQVDSSPRAAEASAPALLCRTPDAVPACVRAQRGAATTASVATIRHLPARRTDRRGRLRLQPRKCFGEISERSVQAGGNCSQEDQSSPCRAVADIRPRVPLSLEIRGLLPCSGRSALGEESVRRVHASERASEVRGTAGRSRRAENVLSRPSSCGFPEG